MKVRMILSLIFVAIVMAVRFPAFPVHAACGTDYQPCTKSSVQCFFDEYNVQHCTTVLLTNQCCYVIVYPNGTQCCYDTCTSGASNCGTCHTGTNGCNPGTGGGDDDNDPPPPTNTPVPGVGTLQARAVVVSASDTSCTAIQASTTGVSGTEFGFTAGSANQPASKTQSGSTAVNWASQPTGWYNLDYTPTSINYILSRACLYSNGSLIGSGTSEFLGANETVLFDLGFTLGAPWAQASGGDVYASGTLTSYIPAVTPRVFNSVGTGGYPGVVTYGGAYDFDGSEDQGEDLVSVASNGTTPLNWLANATRTTVDYYDYFYRRYGSPTVTDNSAFINLAAVSKPASRSTPYYIDGDMTTSGDWVVGSGESIVFIVNGNLGIGGNINITGTGFISFIVNGNVTVASAVGTTSSSSTPVVEGIYIVSPTGTFHTGLSTTAGAARFVGKGMFIAGNFDLERDLEAFGGNTNYSGELFVYNPQLLITMPDQMKELPVVWQEVAP